MTQVQCGTLTKSPPPLELMSHFGCAVKGNWEMLPPTLHGMVGTAMLGAVCSLLWYVSFGLLPFYLDPELAGGFTPL